jgi:hypothetical protein
MAAVEKNGFALWYVHEQTPEVCMAAVKGEGEASVLGLVHEQTPEICMVAVRQDGEALEYVRARTPEICTEAVKQNARALQFVLVRELDAIPLALRLEVAGGRHEAFSDRPLDTPAYSPLDTLAKDGVEAVRVRVAENPYTCHNTLSMLARDEREAVRVAVAGNPSTPPELLAELKNGLAMAKIPTKVGSVDITPEQRQALQEGKSVTLSGLVDKAGSVHETTHVIFDKKAGKVKLMQEKSKFQSQKINATPARSRQSKFKI